MTARASVADADPVVHGRPVGLFATTSRATAESRAIVDVATILATVDCSPAVEDALAAWLGSPPTDDGAFAIESLERAIGAISIGHLAAHGYALPDNAPPPGSDTPSIDMIDCGSAWTWRHAAASVADLAHIIHGSTAEEMIARVAAAHDSQIRRIAGMVAWRTARR
jgi:hypothetical protein